MIFLSKYQDNQPTEPVKTKASPFEFLTEPVICLKKYLEKNNHQEEKLIFVNPWSKNGE
ncbi:MAG: hypothetical protein Q7J06_03035 [Bacteroidales bacterium]|nr:hypothetical protein [Bacteroidales bacterium]